MTGPLPDSLVSAPGVRDLSGTVTLPDVSTGQHLLALLPQAVLVLLVTAGAVLLFQVVRALRRGDVFEPASVARLRALALLIIIGGTAAQWIHDLTRNELLADAPVPGEAPDRLRVVVPADDGRAFGGVPVGGLRPRRRPPRRRRGHGLMPPEDESRVVCHLDALLERRAMTLTDLAAAVGVTVVNLSVLKNNRARAIRYSTLTAICDVLNCQPGDLLTVSPPSVAA